MLGPAGIELLESRVLCAGDGVPPTLQQVRLVGTPGQATGIALTFSGPLDRAAAENTSAYEVRGGWRESMTSLSLRKLRLASAQYDDATHVVTLVPAKVKFDAGRYLRSLRVAASVTGAGGTPLDGNGDGVGGDGAEWTFAKLKKGRTVAYYDGTGSRVTLRLAGRGRLRLLQRLEGTRIFVRDTSGHFGSSRIRTFSWGEGLQLWVERAGGDTVLTGTVGGGFGGDRTTSFTEIFNPGGARLDLLADPAFQVIP